MNDWIQVAIAIGAGLVVGLVASRIVHAIIGSPSRPEPLQKAAAPLASLAFSVGVIGGLVVALGIVQPDALDQLVQDTVSFVPKLLSAAIIVIAANVVSAFATSALAGVVGRLPIQTQRLAHTVVKATIITLAVLLAVGQVGINTDVLNMGVSAVFFGIAASLTLLVGLGGNGVAREVAATRALRRLVSTGDTLEVGDVRGSVVAIHPTAVEIAQGGGQIRLIPSSQLVSEAISIERAPVDPSATTDA
jgi:small-conductance mechanosensitive channel